MKRSARFFAVLAGHWRTGDGAVAGNRERRPRPITQSPTRSSTKFRLDAHIPGIVYGIVENGSLVHVGTFGIQDTESARPVTADTLFRVASMTKAFTALHDPEAARRRPPSPRCPGCGIRPGNAQLEISDRRLAADPRA